MRKGTHFIETCRELPHALRAVVIKGGEELHEILHWADQELSVLEAWMVAHIKKDESEVAWSLWQHRYDMGDATAREQEGEFCCLQCGANASFHSRHIDKTPRCTRCHAAMMGKEDHARH